MEFSDAICANIKWVSILVLKGVIPAGLDVLNPYIPSFHNLCS